MNWIPKKTSIVLSWALLGLCFVLYFSGLFLVLNKIKNIQSYYSDTESKSSREERVRIIKSITDTNKANIAVLRDFFVQKGDEAKFIEDIETVAKNAGIKFQINSIDVDPNQPKSFKEDVSINMAVEGSWQNVMRFLDKVQKMSFGVAVGNLNLDAKSASVWSGSVNLTVFRER